MADVTSLIRAALIGSGNYLFVTVVTRYPTVWSGQSLNWYASSPYNGSCEKDVKVRIGKAAAVFAKMRKIWRNSNISLNVTTRLYEAIILSTLLYGTDVWPLIATLTKSLDATHHRWLRSILGISWKDRITNVEVRARTGQQTMDNILRERRLRWLGHIFRMDHKRIPQQALYWQVPYQDTREGQVDQERTGGA